MSADDDLRARIERLEALLTPATAEGLRFLLAADGSVDSLSAPERERYTRRKALILEELTPIEQARDRERSERREEKLREKERSRAAREMAQQRELARCRLTPLSAVDSHVTELLADEAVLLAAGALLDAAPRGSLLAIACSRDNDRGSKRPAPGAFALRAARDRHLAQTKSTWGQPAGDVSIEHVRELMRDSDEWIETITIGAASREQIFEAWRYYEPDLVAALPPVPEGVLLVLVSDRRGSVAFEARRGAPAQSQDASAA